jgi:dienelactone hydrolase
MRKGGRVDHKKWWWLIGIALVAGLVSGASLASHLSSPSCTGLVVLDPSSVGGHESFEGCLLTAPASPAVGVVLLHGRTSTPNGPVVDELRNSLYRAGYTTLSIENPAADPVTDNRDFASYSNDALTSNYAFPEAYARVQAAINYLQGLGVQRVVLVGFSMGSRLATAAVARITSPSLPIIGLIGIGMYNTSGIDPLDHDFTLDEVSVPVLDIYGDADTNAVSDHSGRVTAYASGRGTAYTQVVLDCAAGLTTNDCHKLIGLKGSDGDPLESHVTNWITCNAPLTSADCSRAPALTWDGATVAGGTSGGGGGGGGSGGGGATAALSLAFLGGWRMRKFYQKNVLINKNK